MVVSFGDSKLVFFYSNQVPPAGGAAETLHFSQFKDWKISANSTQKVLKNDVGGVAALRKWKECEG